MDKLFQSKWFIRIISLAFAITLYVFVTVETNVTQDDSRIPMGTSNEVQVLEDVPLGIKIDANQYVVSGVPEHVKVTLEGKTSVLTPIVRQLNFNVFVDLRELSEGEHTVEVQYENLPDNITAYIEPKTIDVNIEKRTSKEFTVEVDLVNEDKLPLGYELGIPEVQPQTVTLISSEAIIDQVAMVKVFIDVTDLKESIRNRELPISVYDIQGNDLNVRVEPESVTVSLPVERPSKTVPLTIATEGDLRDNLELVSIDANEQIEIFGKRTVLNEVSEITTKPLDLSKVTESGTYEVELIFPEGTIANDEFVEVDINLDKRRLFNNVTIDNKAANGTAFTIIEPESATVNVEAIGRDDLINKLKQTDIKAFVKLSNTTSGTREVNLTVEGPRGVTFEPDINRITISIP